MHEEYAQMGIVSLAEMKAEMWGFYSV